MTVQLEGLGHVSQVSCVAGNTTIHVSVISTANLYYLATLRHQTNLPHGLWNPKIKCRIHKGSPIISIVTPKHFIFNLACITLIRLQKSLHKFGSFIQRIICNSLFFNLTLSVIRDLQSNSL